MRFSFILCCLRWSPWCLEPFEGEVLHNECFCRLTPPCWLFTLEWIFTLFLEIIWIFLINIVIFIIVFELLFILLRRRLAVFKDFLRHYECSVCFWIESWLCIWLLNFFFIYNPCLFLSFLSNLLFWLVLNRLTYQLFFGDLSWLIFIFNNNNTLLLHHWLRYQPLFTLLSWHHHFWRLFRNYLRDDLFRRHCLLNNLFRLNCFALRFSFYRWLFFLAICLGLSGDRFSSIVHRFTKKLLCSGGGSTSLLLFHCTHESSSTCSGRSRSNGSRFLVRSELRELGNSLMMGALIRWGTLFSVFLTFSQQGAMMWVWVRIFNG